MGGEREEGKEEEEREEEGEEQGEGEEEVFVSSSSKKREGVRARVGFGARVVRRGEGGQVGGVVRRGGGEREVAGGEADGFRWGE